MVCPFQVQVAGATGAQEAFWYEPERVPLEQVRDCEVQVEPKGTVAV